MVDVVNGGVVAVICSTVHWEIIIYWQCIRVSYNRSHSNAEKCGVLFGGVAWGSASLGSLSCISHRDQRYKRNIYSKEMDDRGRVERVSERTSEQ